MKATCAFSGLTFTVEHFPFTMHGRDNERMVHPAFHIDTKRLTGLMPKYAANELTEEDTRLLFLALLHSTGLIVWKRSAAPTTQCIEKHLIPLSKLAMYIYTCKDAVSSFPSFVISEDTFRLDRMDVWLDTWNDSKEAITAGLQKQLGFEEKNRREEALERILRNKSKDMTAYAGRLAEWADKAAAFPTFNVTREDALGGVEHVPCNVVWKELIRKCGEKNLNVWDINKGDLQDILDHLSDNLEVGTIYSNALFKLLERTMDKQDNFLGIDIDAPYMILSSKNGEMSATEAQKVEDNAILSLIQDAPHHLPQLKDYATKVEYLRAMGKWKTAQKVIAAQNLADSFLDI